MKINLRPATTKDAELLLAWRNDPETRAGSHNTAAIDMESHMRWLSRTLKDPNRRVFIAMLDTQPVGTVRADFDGKCHEFSWTVAPNFRGCGIARKMTLLLAERVTGPIRAEVKADNAASVRVAEAAGMRCVHEVDGVLHFALQR